MYAIATTSNNVLITFVCFQQPNTIHVLQHTNLRRKKIYIQHANYEDTHYVQA